MKESETTLRSRGYSRNSCIEADDLWAWYDGSDLPILRNVTLKVAEGELTLLCGPTGSGKTTLLRIFRGLHEEFDIKIKGRISIRGRDPVSERPELLSTTIGMALQKPHLQLMNLAVSEEIELGPLLMGQDPQEAREHADDALGKLELKAIQRRLSGWLSPGEQARTVVASMLSLNPAVLLVDETHGYLPPLSRLKLLGQLRELARSGVSVVVSSHRLEEDVRVADRLILIDSGKIVADGIPSELLFREVFSRVMPSRGFLLISEALWRRKLARRKILNPEELNGLLCRDDAPVPSNQTDALIVCRELTLRYPDGTLALDKLSCGIPRGLVTCVLGANGAGKTSFVKCCIGIVKPTGGNITYNGTDMRFMGHKRIARLVGYVPADPKDMFSQETVREEIEFGPMLLGLSPSREFLDHLIATFGLSEHETRHPDTLSVGQQRSLALAASFAVGPECVFLDEPSIGLDSKSLENLVRFVMDVRRIATIVIITQDTDIFVPLCDHVIVLKNAAVIAEGHPRRILSDRILASTDLKLPELWRFWKAMPHVKTWGSLCTEIVRGSEDDLRSRLDS